MNINDANQAYYLANGTLKVPNLLASVTSIQESIRLKIEASCKKDPIRVLELGFGSRLDRYKHIEANTDRDWQVTLSDFDLKVLPSNNEINALSKVKLEKIKLDLNSVDLGQNKFDVILSTYVLDSLDFESKDSIFELISTLLSHLSDTGIFITLDKIPGMDHDLEPQFADKALFRPIDLAALSKRFSSSYKKVEYFNLGDWLDKMNQTMPVNLDDHGILIISKN